MKKLLVLIFGVAVPLIMIVVVFLGYSWVYESNVNNTEPYEFFVYEDDDPKEILAALLDSGIVEDKASFVFVAQQKKWYTAKPGRYLIEPGMSNNALVNMFRAGLQAPLNVTINMAQSVADVAGQAGKFLQADSASIFNAFIDADFLTKQGLDYATVRTIIIPNTYQMYWSTGGAAFRDRMLDEYRTFWNDERSALAKNIGLSPAEVSVLASIVEKETAKREEMPVVAGLYLNRLNKGMLLQSDPTVIYAKKLQEGDAEIQRVLYADLKIDSPYNTYVNKGLPPAPITIPSITAMDAVLRAEKHNYIFMCANPDKPGYHSFAKNSSQHAVNVRKWHQWLNDNKIMR